MSLVNLHPRAGKPLGGDLVWSALPDAPVVPPKTARQPRVRY